MIDCRMSLKGDKISIRLKGHAGYATEGQDIVCAAASTLCNTLVGYLMAKEETEQKHRLEKGNIEIKINLENRPEEMWEIVCFVAVGFQAIACSFPENFSFIKNF